MSIDIASGDWTRYGRGLVLQFLATDSDVRRWFRTGLCDDYAPYILFGTNSVLSHGEWVVDVVTESPLLFEQDRDAPRMWWIVSESLTPTTERELLDDDALTLHGAIKFYHGFKARGKEAASFIACTDSIQNTQTGEVVVHTEYAKIFRMLSRTVSGDLLYSQLFTSPMGPSEEDRDLVRMTESAHAAAREGVYLLGPGSRLAR